MIFYSKNLELRIIAGGALNVCSGLSELRQRNVRICCAIVEAAAFGRRRRHYSLSYCPFKSHACLVVLLAVAAGHHVAWPTRYDKVSKGGQKLNFGQVLGLGLEQVFKYLLGKGVSAGSCCFVVFSNAVHPSADSFGRVGIPLTLTSQLFLQRLGAKIFQYFYHLRFHILGTDAPYAADASKYFDLVGVLREQNSLGFCGRASVEVFTTSLPWGHVYNRRKRRTAIENLAMAGEDWVAHFLLVIGYGVEPSSGEPFSTSWNFYHLRDGDWVEILQGVNIPALYSMSALQLEFQSIVTDLGKPFNTRGARGPEYRLRKFSDHPLVAISTPTGQFALQRGVKGLKGLKLKKGIASGGKKGKQWLRTVSAMERIHKRMRRGY